MNYRRYLLLFVLPYGILLAIDVVGYTWTAAQERAIRANAAHYAQLQGVSTQFIREQCVLDQIAALKTIPKACDHLDDAVAQPEETP